MSFSCAVVGACRSPPCAPQIPTAESAPGVPPPAQTPVPHRCPSHCGSLRSLPGDCAALPAGRAPPTPPSPRPLLLLSQSRCLPLPRLSLAIGNCLAPPTRGAGLCQRRLQRGGGSQRDTGTGVRRRPGPAMGGEEGARASVEAGAEAPAPASPSVLTPRQAWRPGPKGLELWTLGPWRAWELGGSGAPGPRVPGELGLGLGARESRASWGSEAGEPGGSWSLESWGQVCRAWVSGPWPLGAWG